MVASFDGILEDEEQFYGPDFSQNKYLDFMALYRRGSTRVSFGAFFVPSRLEALMLNGKWKQHPIVFLHLDIQEVRKTGNGTLVVFLERGYTTFSYPDDPQAILLYEEAKKLGLTEGHCAVQTFVREEE